MAKNAAPELYLVEERERYWDGRAWTDSYRPASLPPGSPEGWYREKDNVFRWWTGERWIDARASGRGRVSVQDCIGQTVISTTALGQIDAGAIAKLMAMLDDWPAVRIVDFTSYTSPVAAGTTVVAVIEWSMDSR